MGSQSMITWDLVLRLARQMNRSASEGHATAEDGALLARMVLEFDHSVHGLKQKDTPPLASLQSEEYVRRR